MTLFLYLGIIIEQGRKVNQKVLKKKKPVLNTNDDLLSSRKIKRAKLSELTRKSNISIFLKNDLFLFYVHWCFVYMCFYERVLEPLEPEL